jgi:uncharacterized membrane protein YdbT with pleckstrin-like domain
VIPGGYDSEPVPYPTRLLDEGEDVVVDLRPHWSFLAGPIGFTLAAMAGALAGFVLPAVPGWGLEALGVLVLVGVVWVAIRYARWTTTSFVVTNERVILSRGVLGRQGREIPLSRVADLSYHQTLGQRLVGCGAIVIESGGERGQAAMARVPRPAAVQRLVSTQVERSRRAGAPARTGSVAALPIPDQLEKLDDLCRRGIISRAELEAKRAELLARW